MSRTLRNTGVRVAFVFLGGLVLGLVAFPVAQWTLAPSAGGLWSTEPMTVSRLLKSTDPPQDEGDSEACSAAGQEAESLLVSEAMRLGIHEHSDILSKASAFFRRVLVERLLEQEIYAGIRIDEVALKGYFDAHRNLFRRAPQVRVMHFFFAGAEDASREEREAAHREAQALVETIGGDLERAFGIADRMNQTAADGRRFGDIGYFARGRFGDPVDRAVFALTRRGEMTTVAMDDGVHVFYLADRRDGTEYRFDDVQQSVFDHAERAERRVRARAYLASLKEKRGVENEDMVLIKGGDFWMGSTEEELDRTVTMARKFVGKVTSPKRIWYEDERFHLERIRSFYMDRMEVAEGQYQAFIQDTGHPFPPTLKLASVMPSDLPVTGVTQEDAAAFCRWTGKRLPSVEEWEFAARGSERRWFPWGDQAPDGTRANYGDQRSGMAWADEAHDDGYARLAPVGRFPGGATPEGLLDMAGNAREWTASAMLGFRNSSDDRVYPSHERDKASLGDSPSLFEVYFVKGGSWRCAADDLRTSDIRILPRNQRGPVPSMGFRCVRDAL
jgi:formylglycine-generating enzyme required for sulfatase activity